jgi:hypothetical protein
MNTLGPRELWMYSLYTTPKIICANGVVLDGVRLDYSAFTASPSIFVHNYS